MSFAIAGTVLTVAGTAYAANRATAAGRASARGADAATAESARQYDQTRQDLSPYRVTGGGALNRLADLFGLPSTSDGQFSEGESLVDTQNGVPAPNRELYDKNPAYRARWDELAAQHQSQFGRGFQGDSDVNWIENALRDTVSGQARGSRTPDMSAFTASPGYQFRRDEGTRGIERSAAASGGAFSGNALRALAEFNSGLASQEFGNYVNQLSGIAGVGQSATNTTAAYGADHAANAGANARYAGDARASGIENRTNIIGQGLNSLAAGYGYYSNRKRPQTNYTMWEDG